MRQKINEILDLCLPKSAKKENESMLPKLLDIETALDASIQRFHQIAQGDYRKEITNIKKA